MGSAPVFPYPGGVAGEEPPDPTAGAPGHFAWSRWIKQFVKNLDSQKFDKSGGNISGPVWIESDLYVQETGDSGGRFVVNTDANQSHMNSSRSNQAAPLTIWASKIILANGAENPVDGNAPITLSHHNRLVKGGSTAMNIGFAGGWAEGIWIELGVPPAPYTAWSVTGSVYEQHNGKALLTTIREVNNHSFRPRFYEITAPTTATGTYDIVFFWQAVAF